MSRQLLHNPRIHLCQTYGSALSNLCMDHVPGNPLILCQFLYVLLSGVVHKPILKVEMVNQFYCGSCYVYYFFFRPFSHFKHGKDTELIFRD